MIKVVIVDDHKLFRQGLAVILATREEIEVVGRYETAIALLENLPTIEADLILLDIDMPEMDGITATPKILDLNPSIKIIILSMHLDGGKIQQAVEAKVNGYLLKTSDDNEVVEAIHQVVKGGEYFSNEVQDELLKSNNLQDEEDEIRLTKREIEILELVCQEMNSQEIAKSLFISVHTAETHRRNLLNKTGCKNSIGLVKFAMENDYL
ncbi:MAG: response regulator transcription factor [Vicingaceae bacterium]